MAQFASTATTVRNLELASLRRHVGYVSQEAFLFDGTIADNIRYGRFEASDEDVRGAARAAEAHEFVTGLPEGYDARVGERGVKLRAASTSASPSPASSCKIPRC